MNLLLLFESDFSSDDIVTISGRRFQHLTQIKKLTVGSVVAAGVLNGKIGQGTVTAVNTVQLTLQVSLVQAPPAMPDVELILALPRPKMLKRIIQSITALGVKRLVLVNSQKVEKSYWQSPVLSAENLQEQLILGLEQAKDTQIPDVTLETRLKPFVEDRLPALIQDRTCWIAHPGLGKSCVHSDGRQKVTYVIGPEGGFTDYEVTLFRNAGAKGCHLGNRILKVETAVPVILARHLSD